MFARTYTLGIGVAFIAAGIGGFIPLFMTDPPAGAPSLLVSANYGLLLGLFPVNLLHNLYHVLVGTAGVLSWRQVASARRFCQVFALLGGSLTLLGLLPGFHTLFGLMPIFGHDVWLHGAEALGAALLGFTLPARFPDRETSHVR